MIWAARRGEDMERKYPYGQGIVKWVSTGWLEEHLSDGPVIIDTQPNIHDYLQEHILGAFYLNENLFRDSFRGIPGSYVPPAAIQPTLRRLGLHPDKVVVVYTGIGAFKHWGDGLEQTMVAYSLSRFGHNNVYLLDGGLNKWKEEGRPVTKVFTAAQESEYEAWVRRDYFIEYEEFKAIKDSKGVIVLDARPLPFYEGWGPWIKPGHIPGAISLPWASLMDDKNKRLLKSDEEIHDIVHAHNITPDKMVICTCGTGREATNEFLLFKYYLGYPWVKLYEGSFTEWTAYEENPTVTGKDPYVSEPITVQP